MCIRDRVGTDHATSVRALELAEAYREVFAVVGWHPSSALEAPEDIRPLFRQLLGHPKVIGVGETGLDNQRLVSARRSRDELSREKEAQRRLFIQHLDLAQESGLGVVIHHRGALEDVLALMAPYRQKVRGQFHCFVGGTVELNKILEIGGVVSFTGILTYPNAVEVRNAFLSAPLESVMFETDCPYLAPASKRGKRCEPADLMETVRLAAELRGVTLEELGKNSCAAAHRVFPKLG
ncbi:MAG: TatD family hydrolase, partial [Verrucomicrobiae bacterium]|nr:TatD family hydrolase [Verrucomicrobiae bacterium]